jgi:CheY-like chemotaxis protein
VARVLVVEDEQTDRVILASIIEGAGHEVFFAPDGEQAFKAYMRMSIDVVVTDLLMPNVSGLEFIGELKGLFPDQPVIAVSGKGPELLAEAESKGADMTLSKPIDAPALLEAIAKAAPDSSSLPLPKSKSVIRDNYRPLDEFEFEHKGRVRCIPAGGVIDADDDDDDDDELPHITEPLWEVQVDGAFIGRVDANLHETMETVRIAATRLIDQLAG